MEKAYKQLFSKYSWCMEEGGILRMPVSYPEWKFDTTSIIGNYKGTNLSYGVLCEPISSDNEEKEVDKLTGDHTFNLQKFT